MEENILYYSRMKPNDIYNAAANYVSHVNSDSGTNAGSRSNNQQPSEKQSQQASPMQAEEQSGVLYYQQPKPTPAPVQVPKQPTPTTAPVYYYQKQPLLDISVETAPPVTQGARASIPQSPPRITSKVNGALDYNLKELLFKDVPVKVGEVINPANFFVVLQRQKEAYDLLKQQLKIFYEANPYPLPINPGQLYASKMPDKDEWGRVKVLTITGTYCCCQFIDEGITLYVPENKLFLLDDQFKKLPPRSFKAALLGLSSAIWSYEISNQFKLLTSGKELTAYIQAVEDNVCKCILSNGVNVNEEISKLLTGTAN